MKALFTLALIFALAKIFPQSIATSAQTTYIPTQTVSPTGIIETKINGGDLMCNGSTIQADGKILTTGTCRNKNNSGNHPLFLLRFLSNGLLDTLFGTKGIIIADLGTETQGLDVFVLPDGKITVIGTVYLKDTTGYGYRNSDVLLLRYLPDGKADPSFGKKGMSIISVGACKDIATAAAYLPNGKILISGRSCQHKVAESYTCNGGYDGFLIRTLPNGVLDTIFGQQGKIRIENPHDPDAPTDAYSLLNLSKNNILAAIDLEPPRLLHLNQDGISMEFWDDNTLLNHPKLYNSTKYSRALHFQKDGKILFLRQSGLNELRKNYGTIGYTKWQLTRFLTNGNIDSSFAQAGNAKPPLTFSDEYSYCLATNQAGAIFIGGSGFIRKLSPNGSLDTVFFNNCRFNARQLGQCYEINFLPDGSILTVSNDHMKLGHFFPDGLPDIKFGAAVREEVERQKAKALEKWQKEESLFPLPREEVREASPNLGTPNSDVLSNIKSPNSTAPLSRKVIKNPTPESIKGFAGTVVVKICINRAGKVIAAENLVSKSTIRDPQFLEQVILVAKEWEFSPSSEAEEKEYREIVFRFAGK